MPSFYNGKRFFLTFARCDDTKESLKLFLESKATTKYVVVCKELHEDGFPHLHACVEFTSVQRKPASWLDFNGKHPNKQDPRRWDACKTYCKKDGDFIETEDAGLAEAFDQVDIQALCAMAESEEEWMAYCIREKISYQFASWFWTRCHDDECSIVTDEHPGQICAALSQFVYNTNAHRCLVLRGPSGCGKTTWAKINAPKPALFVSHIDQLKKFRPNFHKSIVFDDVSFTHFPRTSQIHLVDFDNPRAIHCRHAVASIPAGVHKIFTCNEWPVDLNDEAISRRVQRYTVQQ